MRRSTCPMLRRRTDAASWRALSHFGFGAQSALVVVPAVMVEPVTSRPMAMPPQFAWTLGGVGPEDVASGFSQEARNRRRAPTALSLQRQVHPLASPGPADCAY